MQFYSNSNKIVLCERGLCGLESRKNETSRTQYSNLEKVCAQITEVRCSYIKTNNKNLLKRRLFFFGIIAHFLSKSKIKYCSDLHLRTGFSECSSCYCNVASDSTGFHRIPPFTQMTSYVSRGQSGAARCTMYSTSSCPAGTAGVTWLCWLEHTCNRE